MRVVELAHIMAGPLCGMMLADMGAEVIKVEKIDGGDDSRRMVPPQVGDESAAFLMMNRNKQITNHKTTGCDIAYLRLEGVIRTARQYRCW